MKSYLQSATPKIMIYLDVDHRGSDETLFFNVVAKRDGGPSQVMWRFKAEHHWKSNTRVGHGRGNLDELGFSPWNKEDGDAALVGGYISLELREQIEILQVRIIIEMTEAPLSGSISMDADAWRKDQTLVWRPRKPKVIV